MQRGGGEGRGARKTEDGREDEDKAGRGGGCGRKDSGADEGVTNRAPSVRFSRSDTSCSQNMKLDTICRSSDKSCLSDKSYRNRLFHSLGYIFEQSSNPLSQFYQKD